MKPSLTQQDRENLLALADKNGWEIADIAAAIGAPLQTLDKAIKRKSKNSRWIGALDDWLRDFAHQRPEEITRAAAVQESPALYINRGLMWHEGQKLIELGRQMQDPSISVDRRLFDYEDWINRSYAALKRFRSECEESSK